MIVRATSDVVAQAEAASVASAAVVFRLRAPQPVAEHVYDNYWDDGHHTYEPAA